jgi:hypothetical protein
VSFDTRLPVRFISPLSSLFVWSTIRVSNPKHLPWQGSILPIELMVPE